MANNPTQTLTQQYGNLVPTGGSSTANREASYSMQPSASAAAIASRPAKIGTIIDARALRTIEHQLDHHGTAGTRRTRRRSGRAIAACIATFPPAPPYAPSKRSPSMKKDRWSSTRKLASVANTASTPVPGKSSPRTTLRAKPASAPCAATESAKTNSPSVFRPARSDALDFGFTEEIAGQSHETGRSRRRLHLRR